MSKSLLITIIICLGVPFILSLKSSRSRTYRRRAWAVGFCIMFAAIVFIPPDENILMQSGDNEYTGNGYDTQGSGERLPASLYALSEVDLSGYSVVGCAEMAATNWLVTEWGSYPVQNAFDGDTYTCWQDGVEGNGEGTELTATLSENCNLQYIVIYNGQTISEEKFRNNGRVCQLEISNGQFTEIIELADENVPVAVKLDGWEDVSTVTFKINSAYSGSVFLDTCISEIVFYK